MPTPQSPKISFSERLFDHKNQPTVTHWLILINVIIFLINFIFPLDFNIYNNAYIIKIPLLQLLGQYSENLCFQHGEYWRLFSYQFLHASLGHLAFNMIALYFFGPRVERYFGHLRYLLYYLCCGVAAALFSTLLSNVDFINATWNSYSPMVGASGSIYGVMAAYAVLFPHGRVQLLFPPINLSSRQFALVGLGLACAYIFFQWDNAGGEAGHMGGMIAGFILTFFIVLKNKLLGAHREKISTIKSTHAPTNDDIDKILDKIAEEGLDSLTEEERDILRRASSR